MSIENDLTKQAATWAAEWAELLESNTNNLEIAFLAGAKAALDKAQEVLKP